MRSIRRRPSTKRPTNPPSIRYLTRNTIHGIRCASSRTFALSRCVRNQPTGQRQHLGAKEARMDEDVFNTSIRKFLKTLGVGAQREIEKAVRQALADGKIKGTETFPVT